MRPAFFLVLLFAAHPGQGAAAPVLVAPPVKFGRQPQNQAVSAQVRLTNPTAAPIEIRRVEGDCSCLTGQVVPGRLAPGASADLVVQLQTGSLEGSLRHTLFLVTATDRLTVPVSAEIYRYADWTITPPRLIFPASPHGTEATLALRLEYRDQPLPEIVRAEATSPWLEVGPARITGHAAVFTVRKLPGAPSGSVFAEVRIQTRAEADPVLTVPAFAYVTSTLSAHPNPVVMPVVAVGAAAHIAVEITGWDGAHPLRAKLSDGQADTQDRDIVTLTLVADRAGTSTHQLEIYDGDDLVLTVPVIERAEPSGAALHK